MRAAGYLCLSVIVCAAAVAEVQADLKLLERVGPASGRPSAYFGGTEVAFEMLPLTRDLEEAAIEARLFQLSSGLAAEIPAAAGGLEPAAGRIRKFSVKLPEVAHVSDFQLRFLAVLGRRQDIQEVQRLQLRVYPQDLFAELRTWARKNDLLLSRDNGALTRFFEERGIQVQQEAAHRLQQSLRESTRQKLLLIVADGSHDRTQGLPHAAASPERLIIFKSSGLDFPRLIVERSSHKRRVSVDAEIIGQLSGSPPAQELLMEAVRYALDGEND